MILGCWHSSTTVSNQRHSTIRLLFFSVRQMSAKIYYNHYICLDEHALALPAHAVAAAFLIESGVCCAEKRRTQHLPICCFVMII
jgi:hypothetical protein